MGVAVLTLSVCHVPVQGLHARSNRTEICQHVTVCPEFGTWLPCMYTCACVHPKLCYHFPLNCGCAGAVWRTCYGCWLSVNSAARSLTLASCRLPCAPRSGSWSGSNFHLTTCKSGDSSPQVQNDPEMCKHQFMVGKQRVES